jgi:hypothetical protein
LELSIDTLENEDVIAYLTTVCDRLFFSLHFKESDRKVAHNSFTLNLLLKLAPDFDTAWKLYQALERDKRINEVTFHTFNTLISKANKKQEREVMEMLEAKYPELVNKIKNNDVKRKKSKNS